MYCTASSSFVSTEGAHRSHFVGTPLFTNRASSARVAASESPQEKRLFHSGHLETAGGSGQWRECTPSTAVAAPNAAATMGGANIKTLLIDLDDCLYDIEVTSAASGIDPALNRD